jgi:hypothetical protein
MDPIPYILTFLAGTMFGVFLLMIILFLTMDDLKDHEKDPYQ